MEPQNKPKRTIEDEFGDFSKGKKFRYVIAGVCFITAAVFVFIHLGFVQDNRSYSYPPKPFLTRENLWIVNGCLGLVGGALFGIKRFLIGALSGLIAAAAVTGATLLYLSWRDTVYMAEMVIPLCAGLIGIGVYKSLARNSDDNTETY